MESWRCFCWCKGVSQSVSFEPRPFSLPSPLPAWPEGGGFAKGIICIGELEVMQITSLQSVWSCSLMKDTSKGATFYKPTEIPAGFFSLGHYGQPNRRPLHGFILAAREAGGHETGAPPLRPPVDFCLIWSSKSVDQDWAEGGLEGCGFFWIPRPPPGYKAMGLLVTNSPDKPSPDDVRCVRADLTDPAEAHEPIFNFGSLGASTLRPQARGMWARGLSSGTFVCGASDPDIACLKNTSPSFLTAMPSLDQVNALVKHYGPSVFFHPKELYLPSSVPWFFKNGALLWQRGHAAGVPIDAKGAALPAGGSNDGEYWIDLGIQAEEVKRGNLKSAELYVHAKPAMGGSFTDLAMWVFCPFNGPATVKIGPVNFPLKRIGEHVGDWEHFTLRVSNFSGELWSVYFSQHSGGEWVDAGELEFVDGNKAAVYSSKNGHASYARAGEFLQGSEKLGIGIRNDTARSELVVDSSAKYEIVAAEYLGSEVEEPCWLQYMREWGPTIEYGSRSELEKIIRFLPMNVRYSVESIFSKLPVELYGEEGPTGPKEKNMWEGDERSLTQ
ncbi:hypothetical protein At1g04090-like [Wolffia australiana]